MEGALVDFCWGWDAGGYQARPTVEKRDGIAVLKTRSDLLPGALIRFGAAPPRRVAALVTASDRVGHGPDERAVVQLAIEVATAKRADHSLTAQRIASAVGVAEGTVEKLLERAGTWSE